jgi:hypothetical protein
MKNTFGWRNNSVAEGFMQRGWNGLDGFFVALRRLKGSLIETKVATLLMKQRHGGI